MTDPQVVRHQEIWNAFSTFMKYGVIGVAVFLAILAATIVH